MKAPALHAQVHAHAPARPHGHPSKAEPSEFETLLHPTATEPAARPKPVAKPLAKDAKPAHPETPVAHSSAPKPKPPDHASLAKLREKAYVPLLPHLGSHVAIDEKTAAKDKPKPAHPAEAPAAATKPDLPQAPVAVDAAPSQPNAVPLPVAAAQAPAPAEALGAPLPPPPPPLPIEPALAATDSLRVVLFPHTARVSVETAESGALQLRLDVRDGVAHVRATGEAAPLVDARTAELRVALAQEGLALGNFELGQQQRRDEEPERAPDASGFRRPAATSKPATADARPLDGRLHIHA